MNRFILAILATIVVAAGCGDDGSGTNNSASNNTSNNGTTLENNQIDIDPSTCEELAGQIPAGEELSGCYRVTAEVVASAGDVTIAPGTVFFYESGTGFLVSDDGSLNAVGTADEPITMLGITEDPGHWKGLAISSQNPANTLNFVDIRHGGSDTWDPCCPVDTTLANLNVFDGGIVTVENSRFTSSLEVGVAFAQNSDVRGFANNAFADNGSHAVRSWAGNVGILDAESDYGEGGVKVEAEDLADEFSWAPVAPGYEVAGRIDIVEGGSLTIEAGANLLFAEDAGIVASEGVFISDGTEGDPISYAGMVDTEGYWRGIAIASRQPDNRLSYTLVRGGGSDTWDPCCPLDTRLANINAWSESIISLENVTSELAPFGFSIHPDSEIASFSSNTFSESSEAAVALSALHIGSIDGASTYGDIVLVDGTAVTDDATWPAIDNDYEFIADQDTFIRDGATVTIEPGATLLFREGAGLKAEGDGVLVAEGEPDDVITFSGTTETAGWWHGLAFTSPVGNSISNAVVSYGGSDNWDPCCPNDSELATINVYEGGGLTLTDSTVFGGENFALYVNPDSSITQSGNDFQGEPTNLP